MCERSHFFLLRISSGRRVLEEARGRARAREEESSQTARGKADGKTRSAGAWETQEEPAGIVGGKSFVSFGEPFRGARAPGSPSPPPRSDLLQTRSCPRGSPPAAGTPPARRNLGCICRFACFGGFPRWLRESASGEGISFPLKNIFWPMFGCVGIPPSPFLHGRPKARGLDGGAGGRGWGGEGCWRMKEFCSSSQSAPCKLVRRRRAVCAPGTAQDKRWETSQERRLPGDSAPPTPPGASSGRGGPSLLPASA